MDEAAFARFFRRLVDVFLFPEDASHTQLKMIFQRLDLPPEARTDSRSPAARQNRKERTP